MCSIFAFSYQFLTGFDSGPFVLYPALTLQVTVAMCERWCVLLFLYIVKKNFDVSVKVF